MGCVILRSTGKTSSSMDSIDKLLEEWFEAEYAHRSGLSSAGPRRQERLDKAITLRRKLASLLWDLGA